jgi:hypothetical protein
VMRHFPVVRAEWPQSEESPDPETVEEESPEPTVQPDPAPLLTAAPPMAGPALPPAPAEVFGAGWLADSLVTP